jgi:hypothetical protein
MVHHPAILQSAAIRYSIDLGGGDRRMKLPVWHTTIDVLDYMWRERRPLVRVGLPTVIITLALAILVASLTDYDPNKPSVTMGVVVLLQVLVYVPATVVWYRSVALDTSEAARHPFFKFGRREMRFFGWQVAVSLVIGVWAVVGVAVFLALSAFNRDNSSAVVIGIIVAWMILSLGSLFALVTRFSMVLVLVALDRPVSFLTSWKMTQGLTWRLIGTTVLIVLAGTVVTVLFKLGGFIVGAIATAIVGGSLKNVLPYIDIAGQNIAGLFTILGIATLFGLVYKKLATECVPSPQETVETSAPL